MHKITSLMLGICLTIQAESGFSAENTTTDLTQLKKQLSLTEQQLEKEKAALELLQKELNKQKEQAKEDKAKADTALATSQQETEKVKTKANQYLTTLGKIAVAEQTRKDVCNHKLRKRIHFDGHGGDLETPGFFDVGAGYFQIHDVDGQGHDSNGLMIALKAYPLRRHYSVLSSDTTIKNFSDTLETNQNKSDEGSNPNSKESTAPNTTQSQAEKIASLKTALTAYETEAKKVYAVCYPDSPVRQAFSRVYVYLGESISESGDANISGSIRSVGLGWDVTPELSLAAGYAIYKTELNSVTDSHEGLVMSVQLNLAAFSLLRNVVTP
ncbi:hypothetical protein [Agitococcus lubricus]|uniref:Uncharacterized protein n=1 Tax=Agitococcus lubricus TaxID=1077255 RepID=A0A2T5J3Z0_9GAMM|nr:hypothetical protein [Agitococcus lubricus]PTQ91324.1 hypothetical protein C8N29_101397 [Agitococcus lubricus]